MILRILLLAATLLPAIVFAQQPARRPNILFILLDDLDQAYTVPYYRQVLPYTMSLGDSGTWFSNSFVTTPLCCPSRAATLSGRYGHSTGVQTNGGPFGGREHFLDDEPRALPALLYQAGYRTALIGKYINGFHMHLGQAPQLPYGWTDGAAIATPDLKMYDGYTYTMLCWQSGCAGSETGWQAESRVERRGNDTADYSTDVVLRHTLGYINRCQQDHPGKPWFAFVCPTAPHFPIPPAPRHYARADSLWGYYTMPKRPNYFADSGAYARGSLPEDKPGWLRLTWRKRMRMATSGGGYLHWIGARYPADAPKGKKALCPVDWHNRMGSLYAVDEMVQTLVQQLKATGQWENTLLVFTSDNGYNLGAHSMAQKVAPYEEAARVPLMVSGGYRLNLQPGQVLPDWILNVDHAPTILKLAGEAVPAELEGRSYLHRLRGDTALVRDPSILIEYKSPGMANGHLPSWIHLHYRGMPSFYLDLPSYRAIRTERTGPDGQSRQYMLAEWDAYPNETAFKRRMIRNPEGVQRKLDAENQRLKQKAASAAKKEYELYDITADPWQLDNLLYYQPQQYEKLKKELLEEMDKLEQQQQKPAEKAMP